MGIFRKISAYLIAPVVALGIAVAAPAANAGVIQLGFILDRSGSIGSGNWTTIVNGLSSAINTIVPTDSSYEVSVVSFGSTASIDVNHILIDSVASRTAVANAISSIGFTGGGTNMTDAFNTMATALTGSALMFDNTYVNLATDGVPNNQTTAVAARNALISGANVDNLSIEAIGGGVNASFLQNSICYPGPCTIAPTFSFPGNGFYIPVANAEEYATAIANKVAIVTNQVPEPGMMIILGLGIAGIAMRRRMAA